MTDLEQFNLQENTHLKVIHFTTEEDWLELRTKGIGGSDIGALMDLNKYASPLTIYRQKVEGYKPDLSDNVNVQKGKELEEVILNNRVIPMMSKLGYVVGKPDFMLVNDEFEFLRANVDGIAYKPGTSLEDNYIIEIKYVSEYAEQLWNGADYCGVPASYYAQVQLYMAVTGIKQAKVCALFDSDWDLHVFNIPRNDLFILQLKAVAQRFYNFNMAMKVPPKLSVTIDKEDVVDAIKKAPEPTKPSKEMSEYIKAYKKLVADIKEAERRKEKANGEILDMYRKGYCPDDPKLKVKLTTVTSKRFDSKRFQEDNPGLYEQYVVESDSARFTIK